MSEFKGTPGPWEVAGPCCDAVVFNVDSDGYTPVAIRPSRTGGKKTAEYNANITLIAAAPELLEVCLRLRNQLYAAGYDPEANSVNPTKCLLAQAEAAIAKALGQSQ